MAMDQWWKIQNKIEDYVKLNIGSDFYSPKSASTLEMEANGDCLGQKCPVCNKFYPNASIERHVNECLNIAQAADIGL